MSSDDSGDSSGNELLNQIIAEYLAAAEAGEGLDRQELLDRHPDLAGELKSFFADHDKMKELAKPAELVAQTPRRSLSTSLSEWLTTKSAWKSITSVRLVETLPTG